MSSRKSRQLYFLAVLLLVAGLVACGSSEEPVQRTSVQPLTPSLEASGPPPQLDGDRVLTGATLYSRHCASCHKADLSGEADWRTPDDAGIYPAPPHDASGHTWHHSDELLTAIIRDGLDGYESDMPKYAGILTDDEILSIIEYFKSTWPERERAFQWQVTWQESQSDA